MARIKSTALPAVARLGVMRARRVMRVDSDPGPSAVGGGGFRRAAARAPHRGPLRGLGGHVLFEAVAVDAGRSSVARGRRRSLRRSLVVVVGVGAKGSLCPEEGQEHKHGQQAKRPPGDDPGVPGGRQHRYGDGTPPGTGPRPQQHPLWLTALSQPCTDPPTTKASSPPIAERAGARGPSVRASAWGP
jgi:hypothetical protein